MGCQSKHYSLWFCLTVTRQVYSVCIIKNVCGNISYGEICTSTSVFEYELFLFDFFGQFIDLCTVFYLINEYFQIFYNLKLLFLLRQRNVSE